MARKRPTPDDFDDFDDDDVPDPVRPGATTAVMDAPPEAPAAPPLLRWRVQLDCPTPIAHKVLELEAPTAEAARAMFCAANGIGGSSHEWKIDLLSGAPGPAPGTSSHPPADGSPALPRVLPGWVLLRDGRAVGFHFVKHRDLRLAKGAKVHYDPARAIGAGDGLVLVREEDVAAVAVEE